ncbi:hypothetical protein BHM03_00046197 [Ensete ventricosum]|uniref:Uncharacterized protein n=1 Tax=Ensete ventricosum TaxID=4639 RepID=A0A445ML12_ENSVE|nr:hypothetical protein BHM03_00046197 [Ensete ventricosum]
MSFIFLGFCLFVSFFLFQAAFLFKEAGEREAPDAFGEKPVIPKDGFPISVDKLTTLTREHDFVRLQEYGGASQGIITKVLNFVVYCLIPAVVIGLRGYRYTDRPLSSSISVLISTEAYRSTRFIISCHTSVLSSARYDTIQVYQAVCLSDGLSEGWYDGGSIAFAVILVVLVTDMFFVSVIGVWSRVFRIYGVKVFHTDLYSPYQVVHTVHQVDFGRWRSIEGEKGKKKKKRKRRKKKKRRRRIPRVVLARTPSSPASHRPLPGDFPKNRSSAIDFGRRWPIEEEIDCRRLIEVHKDQRAPFLLSGCKVADGFGTMLVSILIC